MQQRTTHAPDRTYFARKVHELALIENACAHPSPLPVSLDLPALMTRKFQSAALCRAETAAAHWSQTETSWGASPCESGHFRFGYEYQRADLSVEGPFPYPSPALPRALPVLYTASGMGAMSAVMLAMRRLWRGCSFDLRADGYPETGELAAVLDAQNGHPRIAVVDSTVDTPASARQRMRAAKAVIFDTSCFAASSGRIRAITAMALRSNVPLVLVRSHTKLDCFGLEYGRLGSVVVSGDGAPGTKALHSAIADFIRLTGVGALPMHFPPFAGGAGFEALSRARTAWTILSCRRLERRLRGNVRLRTFAHGLYLVLFPRHMSGKDAASAAAADLIGALTRAGIPARHAGSFGFDFFACDWFEDPVSHAMGLRLSVGDLPASLVDQAGEAIAAWLRASDTTPGAE